MGAESPLPIIVVTPASGSGSAPKHQHAGETGIPNLLCPSSSHASSIAAPESSQTIHKGEPLVDTRTSLTNDSNRDLASDPLPQDLHSPTLDDPKHSHTPGPSRPVERAADPISSSLRVPVDPSPASSPSTIEPESSLAHPQLSNDIRVAEEDDAGSVVLDVLSTSLDAHSAQTEEKTDGVDGVGLSSSREEADPTGAELSYDGPVTQVRGALTELVATPVGLLSGVGRESDYPEPDNDVASSGR